MALTATAGVLAVLQAHCGFVTEQEEARATLLALFHVCWIGPAAHPALAVVLLQDSASCCFLAPAKVSVGHVAAEAAAAVAGMAAVAVGVAAGQQQGA